MQKLYHGAYPSVLEKAGIKTMDTVISVMKSDESNMVACRMAYTLYNVETKIARIRTTEYLHRPELFSHSAIPIDFLIRPENLITDYIKGIIDQPRSEEHTSELQSRRNLVCRLLLEKKNV